MTSKDKNSLIPRAKPIDVEDPPLITAFEFVQQVISSIHAQIAPFDDEIFKARKGDAPIIQALFDSIHEIKSRAEQAEMLLLDVTSDANKLEAANSRFKPHAESFQKVQKLLSTVQELEKELREGEYDYYRVVAELLDDVQTQLADVSQYVATPHLSILVEKVKAIKSELQRQVTWSFREIGSLTSSERYDHEESHEEHHFDVDVSSLSQAQLIVDVLGEKFRKDLLERFAQLQLISYEKLFQMGAKYAGLEHLEQRYAWFRYLLHLVQEHLSDVIPAKWQVTYHLLVEFIRRTNKHLSDVLAVLEKETVDQGREYIAMLLKSITSTISFENEIITNYINHERQEAEDHSPAVLPESIRDTFDPYLGGYVFMERQELEDILQQKMAEEEYLLKPPQPGDERQPLPPGEAYESAKSLFATISGSLKRCTKFSVGLTYLSLSKEFRVCLHQYSETLKFRCPSPIVAARNNRPAVYAITKSIESNLCRIITTCEYCVDTVPGLETTMKQAIKAAYQEEVDFTPQVDAFNDTVAFATNILVSGELNRMEADFQQMKKISWSSIDNVGDVNNHVKHMLKILADCVPRIRLSMSNAYFLNVCANLATSYLELFLDTIWSLRRISKTGGGQLLLDLNGIKEFLETMPNVKLPEGKSPVTIGKAYKFSVASKLKHIENILKLICTEDSMLEEMFTVLWPTATKEEMDSIMVLKGMKVALPIQLPPMNMNVNLDPLNAGKNINANATKMKDDANKAMTDIKSKFEKFGGNIKGFMGDFMSAINDTSNHSDDRGSTHSSSAHGAATASAAVNQGNRPLPKKAPGAPTPDKAPTNGRR